MKNSVIYICWPEGCRVFRNLRRRFLKYDVDIGTIAELSEKNGKHCLLNWRKNTLPQKIIKKRGLQCFAIGVFLFGAL